VDYGHLISIFTAASQMNVLLTEVPMNAVLRDIDDYLETASVFIGPSDPDLESPSFTHPLVH
jgi:hypothetical protein